MTSITQTQPTLKLQGDNVGSLNLKSDSQSAAAVPLTINLNQHFGDWRDDLARDGFVVLKGAVPKEKALGYRQSFFDWIEKWGMGFDQKNRSTWIPEKVPVVRKGGMVSFDSTTCSCRWLIKVFNSALVSSFHRS